MCFELPKKGRSVIKPGKVLEVEDHSTVIPGRDFAPTPAKPKPFKVASNTRPKGAGGRFVKGSK